MWYLTAFFAASLVYHLVIDRCLSDRKFLIGTLIVLTAITMALADIPVLLPWSIDLACVGTIFMIAGTLLGRAQFFEKKWNIPLIAAVFVIYILTSCLDPGINMSIREYGIYGAFSVPFFIIVGLTGSLLCIWFGKLIENTAPGRFIAYVGKNTIFLLAFHMDLGEELVVAKLQRTFEILSQMFFSHCTKLCIIGHCDALLVADLGQHFLLLRVVDGPATAATGGKHQQSHGTCQ